MDRPAENTVTQWTTPECPFVIEYPVQLLDDIRLAVVDAFHSLQRGGVEIGGVFFGRFDKGRLTIIESAPFECEHALGPSFTLSTRDLANLEKLLVERSGGDHQPVGWYHSHTRSPVHLSQADLEIHRRFFPDLRQVALVLLLHAFEPMRAGFFFREGDGSIHATSSYREFELEPQHVRPAPRTTDEPDTPLPTRRFPLFQGVATDIGYESFRAEPEPAREPALPPLPPPVDIPPAPLISSKPETPPATAAEPASLPLRVETKPPNFVEVQPARPRRWVAFVSMLLGMALGSAAVETRDHWLPRLQALLGRSAATSETPGPGSLPPSLDLTTIDSAGQLLIRWNQQAAAIRNGLGALLLITDGSGTPQAIGLDQPHIQHGSFTYVRQSGRVDVRLTVHQSGGLDVSEVATFLGQAPAFPSVDDETIRKQQDDLLKEAAKWKTDLANQAARTKKLERTIEDLRTQLKKAQQRKRMENQSPDSVRR